MAAVKPKKFLMVLVAMVLSQCSDESPSRPSTVTLNQTPPAIGFDAGSVVTVVSAETEHPVVNAELTVAGVEYETNESGEVALGQTADFGALVDVVAQEFIERQTLARRNIARFELWPESSATGLNRSYTRALVYESAGVNDDGELEPLQRPGFSVPRVAVVPTEDMQNDEAAMDAILRAVGEMNQVLGGQITYSVGEAEAAVIVTLEVDPSDEVIKERNSRAVIRCEHSRYRYTGCAVKFRSLETVRSDTTLHELGHSFGLNHSPDRTELMGNYRTEHPWRFSARERLAMRLMLKREPGNVFPDNDRNTAAFLTHAAEKVIVCGQ